MKRTYDSTVSDNKDSHPCDHGTTKGPSNDWKKASWLGIPIISCMLPTSSKATPSLDVTDRDWAKPTQLQSNDEAAPKRYQSLEPPQIPLSAIADRAHISNGRKGYAGTIPIQSLRGLTSGMVGRSDEFINSNQTQQGYSEQRHQNLAAAGSMLRPSKLCKSCTYTCESDVPSGVWNTTSIKHQRSRYNLPRLDRTQLPFAGTPGHDSNLSSYQQRTASNWLTGKLWPDSASLMTTELYMTHLPNCTSQPSGSVRGSASFSSLRAELCFCITIYISQFLAEYMISGFAIDLTRMLTSTGVRSTGQFWPASLLSLILSATLLFFAQISDTYGGYLPFTLGVLWLSVWSLVAGACDSAILLDISRAMQGLAIAAYTPATFSMIASIYPPGPRKNLILALYSGCAPLGFFGGLIIAGSMPTAQLNWYFIIAAILSLLTAASAYLTIPPDAINRQQDYRRIDWIGSILTTAGLILVAYSLAIEPHAAHSAHVSTAFTTSLVLGPLISGIGCLCLAFYVEGWRSPCPLLPFDFFAPRSVKAFTFACLCFYASYAIWLYNSAGYFRLPGVAGKTAAPSGVGLAMLYIPTAVGGVVLCVAGAAMLRAVPMQVLLLVSAVAWIAAPTLLAIAPLPLRYYAFVLPSMLCATLGIDLTFTISLVFLSAVQPLRYQGLAGAVCSILVNLAMSFALSIAEIVEMEAERAFVPSEGLSKTDANSAAEIWGFRATFIYAAVSAAVGFTVCVTCVNLSSGLSPKNGKGDDMESECIG